MNKIWIVMPAYYAAETLTKTYKDLPKVYDEVVLCDDGSKDNTSALSKKLGLTTLTHSSNKGYGANQKTLYDFTATKDQDIVIMVHPDNQYDTSCLEGMIELIKKNKADFVLGARIKSARKNGMPTWKYLSNRTLSVIQNRIYCQDLSEYHSGLRAYKGSLLRRMPYASFSDSFMFDSETIAWTIANGYKMGEVEAICRYGGSVSSIGFWASLRYGVETLAVLAKYKRGLYKAK